MKKITKKILGLVLCVLMVFSLSTSAYAGSASATASVKGIIFNYTATANAKVTTSTYSASTSYGADAKTVYVAATVVQRNKSTGTILGSSYNITCNASGTRSASVSGTAGSSRLFYSIATTHSVYTAASSWLTNLKAYA